MSWHAIDPRVLIRHGVGAYKPISTGMSSWVFPASVSDRGFTLDQITKASFLSELYQNEFFLFLHYFGSRRFSAVNHLFGCYTVHRGVRSFCAPLKRPDKHNAHEVAEAVIDEIYTGCFCPVVDKKDCGFMMSCLKKKKPIQSTLIGFISFADYSNMRPAHSILIVQ